MFTEIFRDLLGLCMYPVFVLAVALVARGALHLLEAGAYALGRWLYRADAALDQFFFG